MVLTLKRTVAASLAVSLTLVGSVTFLAAAGTPDPNLAFRHDTSRCMSHEAVAEVFVKMRLASHEGAQLTGAAALAAVGVLRQAGVEVYGDVVAVYGVDFPGRETALVMFLSVDPTRGEISCEGYQKVITSKLWETTALFAAAVGSVISGNKVEEMGK